jgi:hypothetical protein
VIGEDRNVGRVHEELVGGEKKVEALSHGFGSGNKAIRQLGN